MKTIRGEHALVREITKRGHPLRGRIERTLGSTFTPRAKYNLSHTLAHLFFPENFAEPVAVSTNRGGGAMKKTYFGKVNLDAASQEAIDEFYEYYNRKKERRFLLSYEKFMAHSSRAKKVNIAPFEATGIMPNDLPMNVGFRNNRPVFFEIIFINIKIADAYARKNLKGLRRKQALSVIAELKKRIPKEKRGEYFHVHY